MLLFGAVLPTVRVQNLYLYLNLDVCLLFPCLAWIFQIAGTFTIAANKHIILMGGALARNVNWVVADVVSFDAGSHMEGVIIAKTSVTLKTGGSMNGRVLTQTFVALQKAVVVQPTGPA